MSNLLHFPQSAPLSPFPADAVSTDALPIRSFQLRVLTGEDAGRELYFAARRVTIGGHPLADLQLRGPGVAGFHCEIALDEREAWVRDLGSRSGTRVDGVLVDRAQLERGATLLVAGIQLRFTFAPSHAKVPISSAERFGELVGATPIMRALFAALEEEAARDRDLLLEGEAGTGKAAAARSIHRASSRSDAPFVTVDCRESDPHRLDALLFGKGGETGALRAARGGTLFLAEVGELPLDLQEALLGELEADRLAGNADVRLVASTRRDLRPEVNARRFRRDLFERIGARRIQIPPLRERPDDLPLLVAELTRRRDSSVAHGAPKVARGFLARLAGRVWPGNVAELKRYLERSLAADAPAEPTPVPAPAFDFDRPLKEARERWNRIFERRYLEEILHRHRHNVSASARAAEVDRVYFYRLLRRHDIKRPAR